VRLKDGTTLLLCRVEDRRGQSHLCAARSDDGLTDFVVDETSQFLPDPENHPAELWGVEDPRITYVEDLGAYCVAYTAYGKSGPCVALALTEDFRSYRRMGVVMQADDKDAALLPRRIDGNFALLHRPTTESGSHIWISFSPDLCNWGSHRLVLPARRGSWWDANKVGLSPPLIETPSGWLMIYHGVRQTAAGCLYRLGLALLDLDDPSRCILRGDAWVFAPEESYEREGDVGNVVFPCGTTLADDGETLRIYYGAADSCIALATCRLSDLLVWLDANGRGESPPPSQSELSQFG